MGKKVITEKEIGRALKAFHKDGGLVKMLAAEMTPRNSLVGSKHGMYENPVEISLHWSAINSVN